MKKRLKDVLDYEQPTKYIVDSQNYSEEFKTPVLTAGKSFILGYIDETEGVYEASKNPVIIFDDFTSASKYVDFDFKVKSSAMKILHLVNPKDSLRYVYYAMQKIDYVPFSHKRLWISDYCNFEIELPDSAMQNRVVADLDTTQKAIDLKRKQLEDLDELVKSKFQEMFGNPVENDKRWEMRVWKELFDTILGKMLDVKKQNSDDEIRLYLGNTNVQWRSFDLNGLKTMTFSNKEIDKLSLKKGDILICEGGESGRCAVWEEENSNILFQKAIHRARIKDPNVIEPHFIPFLMEFLRENNGLKNYVTQATIEHLTGEKLNKLSIIVPPIEQQKVFAEFARKADAANAIIKQEISDLEEMMDSKMDEYFG